MRNLTLTVFLFLAIFTAPQTSVAGPVKTGSPAATERSPFESILELQVRLDRAHFSPGEIDGKDGSNLKRAMTAFARARKIRVKVVPKALAADVEPVLVAYSISAEDVAGPFVEIPEDMMEKAGLSALGYKSVLEALGEKFHASPALLQTLNPGAAFDVPGTSIQVPNVHVQPPGDKATRVVVDRSDASVNAYDDKGKLVARYPATMGSGHDPLPLGNWKIQGVSRNPTFNYNPALFWDAEEGHAKAKIPAGPNNPVGVVWIDLSKPHYGIHGTPEPSTVGKTQSHGCIRLTNWDATELAAMVGPGVSAVLQR